MTEVVIPAKRVKKLRTWMGILMMYGFLSLCAFLAFFITELLPKLSGFEIVEGMLLMWWAWIPSLLVIGWTYYMLTQVFLYEEGVKKNEGKILGDNVISD